MRQIICGFLFFGALIEPIQAYNETEAKQSAILIGAHLLTGFVPEGDSTSTAKFAGQMGVGIHDPVLAAIFLGIQHAYLDDKTALSSASSLFNIAIAQNIAKHFNSTKATGFLVAAGIDMAAIGLLSSEGSFGAFKQSLIDIKLCIGPFKFEVHHLLNT